MAGYPLNPQGNQLPPPGWTGAAINPAAPAGGIGPGNSQSYPVRKAEEIWDWMKATGDQAMDAVSDRALHSYEAYVDELGRRLMGATTWSEVYTAAKLILGPNCYYLGVACGAAANLADMVGDLLALWKMFALAAMYELGGTDRPRNAFAIANPATAAMALEGMLLRPFLGKQMKEADEKVRALMDQLGKIMRDPIKFLGAAWASTKKEYVTKWNLHFQLLKDGGLASQFEAGKLAGEVFAQVILAVLAIVSGVGAVARGVELGVGAVRAVGAAGEELAALTREAPEVVRIAQGLEEEGVSRAGGVASEAEGPEEVGESAQQSKKPSTRSSVKPVRSSSEVQNWADQFPKKNTPTNADPRNVYEIQQTGPTNTQVSGGGEKIWADGIDASDGSLQDAKYIADPAKSPYVDGSNVPDFIRQNIRDDFEDEVRRYGAVVNDPATPVRDLQIITNEPQAVPYFQSVLTKYGVPGSVVVKP